MNKVTINNMFFKSVSSVIVRNSIIKVDGKTVDVGKVKDGILQIKVEGTLDNLETDGSVTCGDVRGDIQAGGSVSCENVSGSVMAGGSISHG